MSVWWSPPEVTTTPEPQYKKTKGNVSSPVESLKEMAPESKPELKENSSTFR